MTDEALALLADELQAIAKAINHDEYIDAGVVPLTLAHAANVLRAAPWRVPDGWKPIATAPKDGTEVDLYSNSGRRWCNYRWDKELPNRGGWSDARYANREWRDRPFMYADMVSHWMPLPAPPPPSGETRG